MNWYKLAACIVKSLGDLDETEAAIERRFKVDPNAQRMDSYNSFQGIKHGLECLKQRVLDEADIANYVAKKLERSDYSVELEDQQRFSPKAFFKMLVSNIKVEE